jgi:Ala-tRNA(Pro) deacylase
MKLDEYLDSRHVPFERLHHRTAYSANRVAQLLHTPGQEFAKTVLLRTGQGYALAVLPATHRVDLDRARADLGEERVEMASEDEIERLFPDCERGAMPPFGSLYQVPTIVDATLAADEQIVFEGQTHEDAIRMAYQDFEAIEHPRHGHFARRDAMTREKGDDPDGTFGQDD